GVGIAAPEIRVVRTLLRRLRRTDRAVDAPHIEAIRVDATERGADAVELLERRQELTRLDPRVPLRIDIHERGEGGRAVDPVRGALLRQAVRERDRGERHIQRMPPARAGEKCAPRYDLALMATAARTSVELERPGGRPDVL